MLGYGNSIILSSTDGELLRATLGYAYGITIGLCEGTDLGYPDGSINSSDNSIPVVS